MKALTMKKLEKLEEQILKKIEILNKSMGPRGADQRPVDKVAENNGKLIAELREQNRELSDEIVELRTEHGKDLKTIEDLLKTLSGLMEDEDARS